MISNMGDKSLQHKREREIWREWVCAHEIKRHTHKLPANPRRRNGEECGAEAKVY